jgi:hypothetical protein
MKTFVILTVASVVASLQARATELKGVNRYSSRAALLAANVINQTRATGTTASGSLSGRFAFLAPRPGLVMASVQPLAPARYSSKARFGPATREITMAPLK